MTSPEHLFDISGIRARIFTLPNRQPFMLSADLAEVYGSRTDLINAAVKRNSRRFPDRYTFLLTEPEISDLKTQNALSSRANRAAARAFTHAGANMLSGVLKSPVADQMAVAINDAFTAMEQAAIYDTKRMLLKLQTDITKKPIYMWIKTYVERGAHFEELWRDTNYSRPKLERAAREMLALGLIPELPKGLQPGLFDNA
ncbi:MULTISPECIES: ORF6N domain-containing protein [unclassified Marinovum]|uniref:ORF6N domain-containing protein n=1 Tax=unclassified Marinovum TaxID=2647166 RepID=UPI003EDBA713